MLLLLLSQRFLLSHRFATSLWPPWTCGKAQQLLDLRPWVNIHREFQECNMLTINVYEFIVYFSNRNQKRWQLDLDIIWYYDILKYYIYIYIQYTFCCMSVDPTVSAPSCQLCGKLSFSQWFPGSLESVDSTIWSVLVIWSLSESLSESLLNTPRTTPRTTLDLFVSCLHSRATTWRPTPE